MVPCARVGVRLTTPGTNGAIRIEAFTNYFVGGFSGTPASFAWQVSTFVVVTPRVSVVGVNGTPVTEPPTGNLSTPDVEIDTAGPVTLNIQASGIPLGTLITLHIYSDNNTDQTVQTTPLVGSVEASTATVNVTFPSGYSLNYVKATWTQ